MCLTQYKIIGYGISQGIGQLKIISGSVPISEVMDDSIFADSLKQKLYLIQEIREFAISSLGLQDSDSYNSIYDQKGKPVLWVVSASPPFKMEEYKWSYPFLGELGYKGFFELEKAKAEEKILNSNGFDTDVGEVNAWSTLGFFDDPILSSMLNKSEGELARLIIHELTHATIYIKSDADYNENLATFVGDNGAMKFLIFKYGVNSKEYLDYINHLSDIKLYSDHMLRGANQLDSLYILIAEKSEVEKRKIKEGFIASIISLVDTLPLMNKQRFSFVFNETFKPNNTYFMTYIMYREQQSDFETEFRQQYKSDFKLYINHLTELYN